MQTQTPLPPVKGSVSAKKKRWEEPQIVMEYSLVAQAQEPIEDPSGFVAIINGTVPPPNP